MNTFTSTNLNRWDRAARMAVAVALLAPVFVIGNGPVLALALIAPYFAATAMMKWDPLYGLVNAMISPFASKSSQSFHKTAMSS